MRDELFSESKSTVKDFTFDRSVVEVFPDMIQRSVPGYSTIISTIEKLTEQFHQADSNLYDLGCSLGAASLSMRKAVSKANCKIIGIDSSQAMVDKCRMHIKAYKSNVPVEIELGDILSFPLTNASVVVMNFTMQFISPELRQTLIKKIYDSLNSGGILIVSEKLKWLDETTNEVINGLHLDFKRANGYSELEISQKRSAIENVMKIDTEHCHLNRFKEAGFSQSSIWYQCFNFASFIAIKN